MIALCFRYTLCPGGLAGAFGVTFNLISHGENYILEIMNRAHIVIGRMANHWNDDYVPGTPEERIRLVWPLTREIASLSVKHDVERRLQRHVTRLVRREG